MARSAAWLLLLALSVLVAPSEAQSRRGKGRGKARPPQAQRAPETGASKLPIYLPGFTPKASRTPPVAPPKPKAAQKEKPPPDPMKEADQVAAAAEHLARQEEARAQFLQEHFALCDLDRNGWLSLREGEITLSIDRIEFRRTDQDLDGRLDLAEFVAHQAVFLARLGAREPSFTPAVVELASSSTTTVLPTTVEPNQDSTFEALATEDPPVAVPGSLVPATPHSAFDSMRVKPGLLLRRYDVDGSAGIDATEIAHLFREAEMQLSPELVVAQMDQDESRQLEQGELLAIAWMASQHLPEALLPREAPPEVAFETESDPTTTTPEALQRGTLGEGPTHFRRLDADDDGFIDEADLRKLQSPARIDLRLRAVLSAMDADGDGRLSQEEFTASMGAARR